jgi:hypothetical protein
MFGADDEIRVHTSLVEGAKEAKEGACTARYCSHRREQKRSPRKVRERH